MIDSARHLQERHVTTFEKTADLAGRLLIAALFLNAGFHKITGYAGTQAYMQSAGVPGALLPLVIALELLGAIAIVAGYRIRIAALALAGFTIVAALLFHAAADPTQHLLYMKNFAIAGGLLLLAARGAGDWSLDARRDRLTSTRDPLTVRG
jgi:putative oxidoreductase